MSRKKRKKPEIRIAAINSLKNNDTVLLDIVKHDIDMSVRKTALKYMLGEINPAESVRSPCVEIAANSKEPSFRFIAICGISDVTILENIIEHDADSSIQKKSRRTLRFT